MFLLLRLPELGDFFFCIQFRSFEHARIERFENRIIELVSAAWKNSLIENARRCESGAITRRRQTFGKSSRANIADGRK